MKPRKVNKEVFELLDQSRPIQGRTARARRVAVAAGIAVLVAVAAGFGYWYAFFPRGRFTSPAPGATVDRVMELEGFTRNIPPERRFLWVVVDVPDLGLCWPHRQIHRVNGPFKAKIHEQGPNQTITVALYAVPWDVHHEILKWREMCLRTGSFEGFPMIAEGLRLDLINLRLKNE